MFTSKSLLMETRNAVMILLGTLTQLGLTMLSGVIENTQASTDSHYFVSNCLVCIVILQNYLHHDY